MRSWREVFAGAFEYGSRCEAFVGAGRPSRRGSRSKVGAGETPRGRTSNLLDNLRAYDLDHHTAYFPS